MLYLHLTPHTFAPPGKTKEARCTEMDGRVGIYYSRIRDLWVIFGGKFPGLELFCLRTDFQFFFPAKVVFMQMRVMRQLRSGTFPQVVNLAI